MGEECSICVVGRTASPGWRDFDHSMTTMRQIYAPRLKNIEASKKENYADYKTPKPPVVLSLANKVCTGGIGMG